MAALQADRQRRERPEVARLGASMVRRLRI